MLILQTYLYNQSSAEALLKSNNSCAYIIKTNTFAQSRGINQQHFSCMWSFSLRNSQNSFTNKFHNENDLEDHCVQVSDTLVWSIPWEKRIFK